jgi:ubiquinone/menaquinone biosynthesis C-methylase UbiE
LICGYTQPASPSDSELEWNTYWSGQENRRSGLYGYIAHFYRKNIIRRTLNRMTEAEFQTGAELLHAGCGSGQVDTEVVRIFRVTALDISSVALEKYRGEIGAAARTVRGSILEIPAAEGSFDGVYNLGVMEHFDREHIRRILLEFRRVLKPGGKVLLFWPPTFGLSVRVLDSVHFIANKVFNRKLQLHPYEISRLESKEDARRTLGLAGFELTRYYFGPMDLFTHAILVGRKAA